MTHILRPYQDAVIETARTLTRRGVRRILIVSPTGSGKTSIGVSIVKSAEERGHVLWVVHRRELVEQASGRLDLLGVDHGIVLAGHERVRPEARVQVASVQTLCARDVRPPANVVVWDECHHCAAASYAAVAAHYPSAHHVGLTATPERSDGATLEDAFDEIVVGPSVRELTALGHLVPCEVVAPAARDSALAKDPVEAWQRFGAGRPTIVFAANVPHSKDLVARFKAAGIAAEHIDGETPTKAREATIARFQRGETLVLSNVYVFTEGFDAPRAEVCLLARGASHASTYLQMVGRVLRPAPGKARALVIDLCGVVHEHGLPDADRVYSLTGNAIGKPVEAARQCPQCGGVASPAPTCARCGFAFPPPELPEVGDRELVRILRPSATEDEKQATFDRLAKVARDRGYKEGWLAHRFKATYGHWPRGMRETRAPAVASTRPSFHVELEDWAV